MRNAWDLLLSLPLVFPPGEVGYTYLGRRHVQRASITLRGLYKHIHVAGREFFYFKENLVPCTHAEVIPGGAPRHKTPPYSLLQTGNGL